MQTERINTNGIVRNAAILRLWQESNPCSFVRGSPYLVEVVLQIRLGDHLSSRLGLFVAQSRDVDGRDERVLRRLERRHIPSALHQLVGDGVVVAVVAVADVLF